jgi:hypothetical protein
MTWEASPSDTIWVIAWLSDGTVESGWMDSAIAKVPDMKPKMTTAVNTRRMRGKRWGYEGITSRFREVN